MGPPHEAFGRGEEGCHCLTGKSCCGCGDPQYTMYSPGLSLAFLFWGGRGGGADHRIRAFSLNLFFSSEPYPRHVNLAKKSMVHMTRQGCLRRGKCDWKQVSKNCVEFISHDVRKRSSNNLRCPWP